MRPSSPAPSRVPGLRAGPDGASGRGPGYWPGPPAPGLRHARSGRRASLPVRRRTATVTAPTASARAVAGGAATLPLLALYTGAEIFAGKVLSNQGSGADRGILAGIQWALVNRCAVVSMSLAPRPRSSLAVAHLRRGRPARAPCRHLDRRRRRQRQQSAERGQPGEPPCELPLDHGGGGRRSAAWVARFSNAGANPQAGRWTSPGRASRSIPHGRGRFCTIASAGPAWRRPMWPASRRSSPRPTPRRVALRSGRYSCRPRAGYRCRRGTSAPAWCRRSSHAARGEPSDARFPAVSSCRPRPMLPIPRRRAILWSRQACGVGAMAEIDVIVSVEEDRLNDFSKIVKAMRGAGLKVGRRWPRSAWWPARSSPGRCRSCGRSDGVAQVERSRSYDLAAAQRRAIDLQPRTTTASARRVTWRTFDARRDPSSLLTGGPRPVRSTPGSRPAIWAATILAEPWASVQPRWPWPVL